MLCLQLSLIQYGNLILRWKQLRLSLYLTDDTLYDQWMHDEAKALPIVAPNLETMLLKKFMRILSFWKNKDISDSGIECFYVIDVT